MTSTSPLTMEQSNTTPTTFHSFPKLPYELRMKIWALALDDARRSGLDSQESPHPKATRIGRAHFFTIFDNHKEGHLVPTHERLHGQSSFLQFPLAAPRMLGPATPGSWLDANTNATSSFWAACAESRAYAWKRLKQVPDPAEWGIPEPWAEPPVLDTCTTRCIPGHVSGYKKRSAAQFARAGRNIDRLKEVLAMQVTRTGKRVEKYVGRFCLGASEMHTFTVLKQRDLVCLQPLDPSGFASSWAAMLPTLVKLRTNDVGFEMRSLWEAPTNISKEAYAAMRTALADHVTGRGDRRGPTVRRFWIVDYRVHLKRGAVWPVTDHVNVRRKGLHWFCGGEFYDFVEVMQEDQALWEFEDAGGGRREIKLARDLEYWESWKTLPHSSGGVLGCVSRSRVVEDD
ncbi:hypothetical protein GE09DRAFT_592410 [Coniochaeta sp. 2T2.1]|nr:hypothetical protein GE09DRAFT_592410 [Coniochaeta sp. 2T2.1]